MAEQSYTEPTFAVATLGCKVNQADSEAISEQMSAAGFAQRDFNDKADIYIVNTCTVTHLGDRSSRQLISQARRRHPDALLVVTGCYAELNPKAVAALPGVDMVVGNRGKASLVEAIQQQWQTEMSNTTAATEQAPPLRRLSAGAHYLFCLSTCCTSAVTAPCHLSAAMKSHSPIIPHGFHPSRLKSGRTRRHKIGWFRVLACR